MTTGQLQLFPGADDVAAASPRVEHAKLAEALPRTLHMGTSSWSFPGWAGLVYAGPETPARLARNGLAAYAKHPLLRCVGIDRTYYGPLEREVYAAYAEQVPDDFRFLVKAPEACTLARLRGEPGVPGEPNPHFLEPGFARDVFVSPATAGLADRAGPLVFQFPPQASAELPPGHFAELLERFLNALPKGPLYAVEIRNAKWLTPEYAQALDAAGACHCLTVHPKMPRLARQAEVARVGRQPALVLRWMLGGGRRYDDAVARYKPFDQIVDADATSRRSVAGLVAEAAARGAPTYVTVNNKAEGSAPRSVFRLAEEIAGEKFHST